MEKNKLKQSSKSRNLTKAKCNKWKMYELMHLLGVVAAVDDVAVVVVVVAVVVVVVIVVVAADAAGDLTATPDCCAFSSAAWWSRTKVLCLTQLKSKQVASMGSSRLRRFATHT